MSKLFYKQMEKRLSRYVGNGTAKTQSETAEDFRFAIIRGIGPSSSKFWDMVNYEKIEKYSKDEILSIFNIACPKNEELKISQGIVKKEVLTSEKTYSGEQVFENEVYSFCFGEGKASRKWSMSKNVFETISEGFYDIQDPWVKKHRIFEFLNAGRGDREIYIEIENQDGNIFVLFHLTVEVFVFCITDEMKTVEF